MNSWDATLQEYLKKPPSRVRGTCFSTAENFCMLYPELTLVHGVGSNRAMCYWVSGGTVSPTATMTLHAWCVAPDGTIVDPTGHQYGRRTVYRYPLKEGRHWAPNATEKGFCMKCFKPRVADYEDPLCCEFTCFEWLCRVLDVEAADKAAALSHRDARRGRAVASGVHNAA